MFIYLIKKNILFERFHLVTFHMYYMLQSICLGVTILSPFPWNDACLALRYNWRMIIKKSDSFSSCFVSILIILMCFLVLLIYLFLLLLHLDLIWTFFCFFSLNVTISPGFFKSQWKIKTTKIFWTTFFIFQMIP